MPHPSFTLDREERAKAHKRRILFDGYRYCDTEEGDRTMTIKIEMPPDFNVLTIQEFPCYGCGAECRAERAQNYDTEEEKVFLGHALPGCALYEETDAHVFIKEGVRKKVNALRRAAEAELINGVPINRLPK